MEVRRVDAEQDGSIQRQRIRDLLAQTPLLSKLPVDEHETLVLGTSRIRASRGDIVLERGAPCEGFHIVVFGQVKLVYGPAGNAARVVRLIGPGDSFGEALMLLEKDSIIKAEALCDSLLLYVRRDAILDRLEKDPELARRLLGALSRQVFMLTCDLGAYTMRSGQQRLIGYLFREAGDRYREPFKIEVGKGVIASRLNLTPEHFSRILRELSDRQLIAVHGREITILDPDGLRAYHG